MKSYKCPVFIEEAVRFVSYYKDFSGSLEDWKDSLYTLFRWDMTVSIFFSIDVNETRSNGVYVEIYGPKEKRERIEALMHDCGYNTVHVEDATVGVVDTYGTGLYEDGLYLDRVVLE